MIKDPDVIDPIRFLREREIVHFQRFGETKRGISSEKDRELYIKISAIYKKRMLKRY
jgi:spore coat protein JC